MATAVQSAVAADGKGKMVASARSFGEALRFFSKAVGAGVAVASALAFVSEALEIGPAQQIVGLIPIHANQQALMAMLLGAALFFQHQPGLWAPRLSKALAWAVTIIALGVLGELTLGWSLGFERMAFPAGFGALSGQEFQRLSLPSALELLMLSCALLLGGSRNGLIADFLALSALGYMFITALIVALRIQYVYGTAFMMPVGVLLLIVLALGILCAHPERGVMKALSSETPTGVVLRRLLPTALFGPTLIGWLWAEGARRDLFEAPEGMFFAVLAMTLVTLGIVGWNVYPLQRLERARDEAVAALRASEAQARRLAAIVEASDDAIMTYDPATWNLTFWSRGAERLWGWSSTEALGKKVEILTRTGEYPQFREVLAELEGGTPVTIPDVRGYHKDGMPIDVSVGLFPIQDEQGRLVAFGSIHRDITEQRRMLVEMTQRTAELRKAEELNRLKDHFLSTISHEMKTPLSLIIGYAELLQESYPQDAHVTGVQDGAQRLTRHIDAILDYSALISGTLPLYRTVVDLTELAKHVLALAHDDFARACITLEAEIAPELPLVEGDYRRLTQILLELLDNVRKFTPPGGHAGLRIAPAGPMVRLEVWNTGEGIPPQDCERIWVAFHQLATRDTLRKGGLGLGLTIVKMLVELHGGTVSMTSDAEAPTTFTVLLPALNEPHEASAPRAGGSGG